MQVDKKRISIAIVEDDEEIRADFSQRIGRNPSFSLLGTYPDAESAVAGLPELKPEVVLMDINLPGMDGVECVRQLKSKMPHVQFVMLTVYEDGDRLFKSLMAGASGYLLKRTSSAKLMAAIQEVYNGGAPMTPEVARRVVQYFQRLPESPSNFGSLTARETHVLEQLSKGYLYKEIVNNLGISLGTLHSYISKIYEKLHVHSRTEAVVKYLNH